MLLCFNSGFIITLCALSCIILLYANDFYEKEGNIKKSTLLINKSRFLISFYSLLL